jgi:transcriptional regulator with XRE-family HTH domain
MARRFMEALAMAAREARVEKHRKQVHIAAALDADQSTVARFERGQRPRDLEAMLLAYSDDLDMSPRELVERALDLWDYGDNGNHR